MIEVCVKKKFKNNKHFEYELKTDVNRIVLFGPSGSGKSNLIKMIAGFLNPDDGIIKVNGNTYYTKSKNLPVFKRRVGYLPQEYTLFPHMTVEENILYGVKINKINLNKDNYINLLNRLNIADKLNYYPEQLSGGERQRVALIRALLVNPDILLLDEPFSSLDKLIRDKLRDTVVEILDDFSTKAIFVTHDFEDAFLLGKEVYIVYNGKIIERGSADKIFNFPEYIETAKMVGFKNIWEIEKFNSQLNLNLNSDFVGIKPENFNLEKLSNDELHFQGKVKKIKHIGNISEIEVIKDDISIIVKQPDFYLNKFLIKENKEITLYVKPQNIIPLKKI